jgi:hypothetical protein
MYPWTCSFRETASISASSDVFLFQEGKARERTFTDCLSFLIIYGRDVEVEDKE